MSLAPESTHWRSVCACLATVIMLASNHFTEAGTPVRLSLDEALDQAFRMSPVLEARRAELREAEARLLGARIYPFNPEVQLIGADRQGLTDGSTERGVAISQEIEIGGQRRKRKSIAESQFAAAESGFERSERLLVAQVRAAFVASLRARELLDIALSDAELTRELLDLSSRRLEEGAGTFIELNLARSATGQAERTLRLAEASYATARSGLAEVIGLAPDQPLEPVGTLPVPEEADLSVDELVASALESRSDLAALRKFTESAFEETRLARSSRVPNLLLGAFYEEEEGTDTIRGLSLTLPIPLFNRNQGRIAEASAMADRLTAEELAAELTVRREVVDAVTIYRSAQQTTAALRDLVVGTLEQNLELLQRALEAGKIGSSDVLVFRREFVEGRRQFVEALFEAGIARIALDLATGHPIPPITPQEEIVQ
jgi:cobalt-zinc-cadmium efflux system outer membrane protein